jgi:hypothetical protein
MSKRDPFADDAQFPEEEEDLTAQEPQVMEGPPPPLPAIPTQPAVASLIRFETEVNLMIQQVKEITIIQDDTTNKRAGEIALRAKKIFNMIDNLEEYYKRPHLDYTSAVRSFAKQYKDPLQTIEKSLGKLMGHYRLYLENERRKKEAALKAEQEKIQARMEAEAKAAKEKGQEYTPVEMPAPVAAPVPKVTRTAEGSVSQKRVVMVEVLDLDKVDSKYIIRTLNEKKVVEDFKAGMSAESFTGLRVSEEFDSRLRV